MFKKAERKQAKLKIGLSGPSGSGKTYSALLIAQGIGGRIALLDTENCSASLYADQFDFDVCEITPPYTTDKYLQAMKAAEADKYDIIIIDSISHQWAGEGGILNRKEQLDARGGNSFTNWSKFTPEHERFKSAILQLDAHTFCTIRSKTEYTMKQGDNSKTNVKQKLGMAPVQRDGFEYEFSLMLDLSEDHSAKASKDRTSLFDDKVFKPSIETGKELVTWLNSAKPVEIAKWKFDEKQKALIKGIAEESKIDGMEVLRMAGKKLELLTEDEFNTLCTDIAIIGMKKVGGQ